MVLGTFFCPPHGDQGVDIPGDILLSPTWGPGCGCLWEHYSVHSMGIRTWLVLGTFFCPPHGDQDVSPHGVRDMDIILFTTWRSGFGHP